MLHTANKMTVIEISEPGGPEVLTPVQTTIPVPKAGKFWFASRPQVLIVLTSFNARVITLCLTT